MQLVYQRACGIDVHKKTIVVCVLLTQEDGTVQRHIRTFSTMTAEVLACVDWLESLQVQMVAMESTGGFWRPIFNLLEAHLDVMVVNAQHMKAVPGRKTDVKDSEWIADLLRHGLLQASFIPPEPIRDLRDLTRYRKTLMQEPTRCATSCKRASKKDVITRKGRRRESTEKVLSGRTTSVRGSLPMGKSSPVLEENPQLDSMGYAQSNVTVISTMF